MEVNGKYENKLISYISRSVVDPSIGYDEKLNINLFLLTHSGAARACLDLGFHRLPNHVETRDNHQKRAVFWYIYSWDKGLAITCGRTPVIHQYDVTTDFRTGLQSLGHVPAQYVVLESNSRINIAQLTCLDYMVPSLITP